MQQLTGHTRCVWQGRRLPWYIAEGRDILISDLKLATSDRLLVLLAKMPAARRSNLLAAVEQIRFASWRRYVTRHATSSDAH
eukprot:4242050-Pyramimonas_sp.AAC.1